MNKFDELRKTIGRISEILHEVEHARRLPAEGEHAAKVVSIYYQRNSYNSNYPKADKAAEEIQKRLAAELRTQGEAECADRIAKLAVEVETLRVMLPYLAAGAALQLGVYARANFPKDEKK